jgi:hypothetical protein
LHNIWSYGGLYHEGVIDHTSSPVQLTCARICLPTPNPSPQTPLEQVPLPPALASALPSRARHPIYCSCCAHSLVPSLSFPLPLEAENNQSRSLMLLPIHQPQSHSGTEQSQRNADRAALPPPADKTTTTSPSSDPFTYIFFLAPSFAPPPDPDLDTVLPQSPPTFLGL